ncbi:MAG: hypothetical protein B7Y25_02750 [Alphaproteobacteria bacterium 16-39-46]|nr:MAG: hypothetical protein B7Y25_02750 [Alphaproteobacteria bacterium 16-39-46]OZA43517.1 MAG: hypothetical protein B7X84_02920 [Alphaproteobacteria bacterium 17-39-52]HQS83832.1 NADH-quinone oxidoreductase subunit N [Alphaproteobacteria bacterium]HQS93705.1 NADH-quinone oxidoreductase subunit N [Alphaproteobacteria bacterium]
MGTILRDLLCFIPELTLGGLILIFLGGAVFLKKETQGSVLFGKVMFGVLGMVGILVLLQNLEPLYIFNRLFISDTYTIFVKVLVLSITICIYSFSFSSLKSEKVIGVELYVFILMALLGMFMVIGSNDFLSFYLGMELQNIAFYVLVSFKKDSLKNNEAAIKYFILGVVASGIFLFGASLLYGAVGSLNFQDIGNVLGASTLESSSGIPYALFGAGVGLLFIMVSFLFKVSIVPFHMWAPDVYEGSPLPIVAFLAFAPKVVILSVILRLWALLFSETTVFVASSVLKVFPPMIMGASLLSIIVGTFGAFGQSNIKRFLAYTGISHMGFVVLGISLGNYSGMHAALVYLLSYIIMGIGFFASLGALRYPPGFSRIGIVKDLSDLKGLSKTHPGMSFSLAILMISFAGLPPLIGFFSKLYLLLSLIETGFVGIAILGGLSSVVAAVYYLRIVKDLYFEDAEVSLEVVTPLSFFIPLFLSLGGTVFFCIYAEPVLLYVSILMKMLLGR